jgi:hypothetical protein
MITSTYCTLIAAVADERELEPEKPCVCEEFDPAAPELMFRAVAKVLKLAPVIRTGPSPVLE